MKLIPHSAKKMLAFICLGFIFLSPSVSAPSFFTNKRPVSTDLWHKLVKKLCIAHYAYTYPVRKKIRWYMNHPSDIKHLTKQSLPFLYYVYQQTQKRGMPAEIALLPMIESDYKPYARSSAGAEGLWQMMPITAHDFGLRINKLYDGRRDIIASTHAALDYLQYLHTYFHNWLLAIAAYNSGQGTVLNAIRYNQRHHKPTDFWSLPLPAQTKQYVPRVLAIAYLLKHMDYFHVQLTPVINRPYFSPVIIDYPISLRQIAKLARCRRYIIRKLNPAFQHYKTTAYRAYTILIPTSKQKRFKHYLHKWLTKQTKPYAVKNGDTISQIAHRYHASIHRIKQLNHLKNTLIKPGQILKLPLATDKTHHKKRS